MMYPNTMMQFPNGLNGKRMTTNPTSRFSRILRFVRANPGVTKREILNACGLAGRSRYADLPSVPPARSQHVYVFRYMTANNILRMERTGNTVRYFAEVQ